MWLSDIQRTDHSQRPRWSCYPLLLCLVGWDNPGAKTMTRSPATCLNAYKVRDSWVCQVIGGFVDSCPGDCLDRRQIITQTLTPWTRISPERPVEPPREIKHRDRTPTWPGYCIWAEPLHGHWFCRPKDKGLKRCPKGCPKYTPVPGHLDRY